MKTTKSPKKVAAIAYAVGKQYLKPYAHKKSPHRFTQAQLLVCLALKMFFKTDYRGVIAILEDSSDLRTILELAELPHFTTLQKAAPRLLCILTWEKVHYGLLSVAQELELLAKLIKLVACDSTGYESGHTSQYYVARRSAHSSRAKDMLYTRYPKQALMCDTKSHLILDTLTKLGP